MLTYCFLFLLLVSLANAPNAQTDTLNNIKDSTIVITATDKNSYVPDDDFNIFLIVFGAGFMCAALGAVMAGANKIGWQDYAIKI